MNFPRLQNIYFFGLLAVVAIFALCIYWPFLTVIAMSVVMAIGLTPLYKRITKLVWGSRSAAALITVVLLLFVIILPLTFLVSQIFQETQSLYGELTNTGSLSIDQLSTSIQTHLQKISPEITFNLRESATTVSAWIVSRLGSFFSSTVDFIFKLLLSLVALFYFLRDGDVFRKHIAALSPLPEGEDDTILRSMRTAVKSVVFGSLVMAVIQGILGGLGFFFFGVPNPSLWGTVTAIASFIPGVGTALVWIPATIYLFFAHDGYNWLGLMIWSFFLVGTIDNFLNPYLLERGIKIHPMLILFSILGGIQFLGPEGVILGPLVLSLLFALVRVYQHSSKTEKETGGIIDENKLKNG